jgi:ribosomal-protein-alanine N-acetyltransferase
VVSSDFPTLETNRLLLRPLELGDAPAIHAYQSDAEFHRYVSTEPPTSPEVIGEMVKDWLALAAEKRRPVWVMVAKESHRVIGTISFNALGLKNSCGQLGYEVAREQWGKGIATEAVRAVLGHGFGTMGLNRIAAYCWDGNVASQRVMEKAGMRYEGTLREVRYAKGAYHDMRLYARLASEWRAGEAQGHDGSDSGQVTADGSGPLSLCP